MRYVLCLALVLTLGCAARSGVPPDVQLAQDTLIAIQILDALSTGVKAAADTQPPVITVPQATQVLRSVNATVRVLQVTNSCAKNVLDTALTQLGLLPFANKLQQYIFTARLAISNGLWPACVTPTGG